MVLGYSNTLEKIQWHLLKKCFGVLSGVFGGLKYLLRR